MAKIAYATKVDVTTTATAAINKVRAEDMNEIKTSVNALYDQGDVIADYTGWGEYVDTQYTSGGPFILPSDTDTVLPNNKATVIETQKPSDITTFYNGTVINGQNGDAYTITIDFTVTPTSGAATYIETWIDIGGSIGELYRRISSFPKGAGVAREIATTTLVYTLNTWEANGGTVYVRSNGACNIYGVRYVIARVHKAR